MMRIITGRARGVRLATLEGDATRPTAERTKEAIFSILFDRVEGKQVLDLFAGSGQLGLEAVSRGATHATLVDRSKDSIGILEKNVARTHLEAECRIVASDYADFIRFRAGQERYDLVFLDPPYALGLVGPAIQLLIGCRLLLPGAIIVCETAEEQDVFGTDRSLSEQFSVCRKARYGRAFVTVLAYQNREPDIPSSEE